MTEDALILRDLKVFYSGESRPSLTVDSLRVKKGEFVLLAGRSGSGKSTLLSTINGVIPRLINAEVEGEIRVMGRNPLREDPAVMAETVGTLLQDPNNQIFNYIVEDEVAFGPENLMLPLNEIRERVEEALQLTGTSSLRRRETYELSGGQVQRVALASILAMRPRLLLLDEPSSNIDPEGTEAIFSLLRNMSWDRTIVVTEHKVERVTNYVDRLVVLDKGRITLDIGREEVERHLPYLQELGIETPLPTVRHRQGLPSGEVLLEARLTVSGRERYLLRDAGLRLKGKQILALIGRNGAGKSTLLKAIAGLLDRELVLSGRIMVEGKDISKMRPWERGKYVAYLPQEFEVMLVHRTVEAEILSGRRGRFRELGESLLRAFSLEELRKEDPLALSLGQKRRVALASVLSSGARVVMLDEPTSGQDWASREALGRELDLLTQMGFGIVVVTHDLRFVRSFADEVVRLEEGVTSYLSLEELPEPGLGQAGRLSSKSRGDGDGQ